MGDDGSKIHHRFLFQNEVIQSTYRQIGDANINILESAVDKFSDFGSVVVVMPIDFDSGAHMSIFGSVSAVCGDLELVNLSIDTHRNKGVPQVVQTDFGQWIQTVIFPNLIASFDKLFEPIGDFAWSW